VSFRFETNLPTAFAGVHDVVIATITRAGGEKLKWSRPTPYSADGCQYTFSYGNQLYFVFVEIPERPFDASARELFLKSAVKARAIPCTMRLIRKYDRWTPVFGGWGLLHAWDDSAVSPPDLQTDKRIEMSDRELQALAVNLVCGIAEQEHYQVGSCHTLTDLFPSAYMLKDGLTHALVVCTARVPAPWPCAPEQIADMVKSMPQVTGKWLLAPVRCAARDEDFKGPEASIRPLYRTEEVRLAFPGFKSIA
jgi:hypothetical protein